MDTLAGKKSRAKWLWFGLAAVAGVLIFLVLTNFGQILLIAAERKLPAARRQLLASARRELPDYRPGAIPDVIAFEAGRGTFSLGEKSADIKATTESLVVRGKKYPAQTNW